MKWTVSIPTMKHKGGNMLTKKEKTVARTGENVLNDEGCPSWGRTWGSGRRGIVFSKGSDLHFDVLGDERRKAFKVLDEVAHWLGFKTADDYNSWCETCTKKEF